MDSYTCKIVIFLSALLLFFHITRGDEGLKTSTKPVLESPLAERAKTKSTLVPNEYNEGEQKSAKQYSNTTKADSSKSEDLISIIRNLDTSDYGKLVGFLGSYSTSGINAKREGVESAWGKHFNELKTLYFDYLEQVANIPKENRWWSFNNSVAFIYFDLAEIADDSLDKTIICIKLIDFLQDNYHPTLFDDNYYLGRAFTFLSLYHPGKNSREGCIIQAIDYYSRADDGDLLDGVVSYYFDLTLTYGDRKKALTDLGEQMLALIKYNELLLSYDGNDLIKKLSEQVNILDELPESVKKELLTNLPEPEEHFNFFDEYLNGFKGYETKYPPEFEIPE